MLGEVASTRAAGAAPIAGQARDSTMSGGEVFGISGVAVGAPIWRVCVLLAVRVSWRVV